MLVFLYFFGMNLPNIVNKFTKEGRRFVVWIRLVFVFEICIVLVHSELVQVPQDTEVVRGMNVSLPCATSFAPSQYVNWFYTPTGQTGRTELYYNNINIKPYYPRFVVSRNESKGEYNMTVSSVDFQDCGLYICVDRSGVGEKRSAELVVLTSAPTVQSNISLGGLTICNGGVHHISLICSLSYKGNIAPRLCWEMVTHDGKATRYACAESDTAYYDTANYYNESTTVVRTATTVVIDYTYDRSSYYCYTRTSGIRSAPVTIQVKYVVPNSDEIRNGSGRYCNVEANVQCEFGLLNTNDEIAKTASQNLTFDSERKYDKLCEYICTIDDQVCKGYQPYYEDDLASCDSCRSSKIGLTFALVTMIIAVAVVIVIVRFKYDITKKKKKGVTDALYSTPEVQERTENSKHEAAPLKKESIYNII